MTRPLRPCLDCGARTRNPGSRCRPCEQKHQKARNNDPKRKALYGGTWQATSRKWRQLAMCCAICGTPYDLTLDHEHGQVECRSCNSSHRRNP